MTLDFVEARGPDAVDYTRRHLRVGWSTLVLFVVLGAVLETLHGFKVGWYLDVGNETRRLMWTLAHAHGTLLALVHIAFALTVRVTPPADPRRRRLASMGLLLASLLLPGGFFLGGIVVHGGDPNLGILLVPIGAVLLVAAVLLTALDLGPRLPPG